MRKDASSETIDLIYEVLMMAKEINKAVCGADIIFVNKSDSRKERDRIKADCTAMKPIRTGSARRFV